MDRDARALASLGDEHVLIEVPRFTLDDGTWRAARVARVVDGDTLHVVLMHDNRPWRFVLRLVDIDTPELHPARSDPDRDSIMREARLARDGLRSLLPDGAPCSVQCGAFDKFGRVLARVRTARGDDVNREVVDRGWAVGHVEGRVAWNVMWPQLQRARRSVATPSLEQPSRSIPDTPSSRSRPWWRRLAFSSCTNRV